MEEDFAVNTGKSDGQMSALADSTSKIQKDKRQETIAEARRFLAVTEAKMKNKFQKASKTKRLPTKTYTKLHPLDFPSLLDVDCTAPSSEQSGVYSFISQFMHKCYYHPDNAEKKNDPKEGVSKASWYENLAPLAGEIYERPAAATSKADSTATAPGFTTSIDEDDSARKRRRIGLLGVMSIMIVNSSSICFGTERPDGTPLSYAPALGIPLTLADPSHARGWLPPIVPSKEPSYASMTSARVLQLYDELSATQYSTATREAERELELLSSEYVRPGDESRVAYTRLEHKLRVRTLERWWERNSRSKVGGKSTDLP
ncbi:MAG: hypothetical protein Q9202_004881 [Teloschistes flavicans]